MAFSHHLLRGPLAPLQPRSSQIHREQFDKENEPPPLSALQGYDRFHHLLKPSPAVVFPRQSLRHASPLAREVSQKPAPRTSFNREEERPKPILKATKSIQQPEEKQQQEWSGGWLSNIRETLRKETAGIEWLADSSSQPKHFKTNSVEKIQTKEKLDSKKESSLSGDRADAGQRRSAIAHFQPLSTYGLPPTRHRLARGGSIEILSTSTRDVLVDFRKRSGTVILISREGQTISLFDDQAENSSSPLVLLDPCAVFPLERLPEVYRPVYMLAVRFVQGMRSKLPKLTFRQKSPFSGQEVKVSVFEGIPAAFEASFEDGCNVRVDRSARNVELIKPGTKRQIFSLDQCDESWASLAGSTRKRVEWVIGLSDVVDRTMNALFELKTPPESARFGPEDERKSAAHSPKAALSRFISDLSDLKCNTSITPSSVRAARANKSTPRFLPNGSSDEFRYLANSGWISRRGNHEFQLLLLDGIRFKVDVINHQIESNGNWRRLDSDLPQEIREPLNSIQKLLLLYK